MEASNEGAKMDAETLHFHAANTRIDEEHRALACLLAEVTRICTCNHEDASRRNCRDCLPETLGTCSAELIGLCNRLMHLLLEHFYREEALMDSLPNTLAIRSHCDDHRTNHAVFVKLYNEAVRQLDCSDVLASMRSLEAVVHKWVREHAMSFDAEFAALVGRSPVRRPMH
jgi:hemerythrin